MPFLLEQEAGEGFEALSEEECFGFLHRGSIGRVAIVISGTPAVFPVNYHAVDRVVYFKSGEGMKLKAAKQRDVVAFQIDEIDTRYHHGWSVLAVGVAEVVDDSALLRNVHQVLQPWAPGHRDNVIQIVPEFVSGRRIGFHATG